MSSTNKAYRYRFYPTPDQEKLLAQTFGCTRYVYNWALNLRSDAYKLDQAKINYHETSAALSELKKEPAFKKKGQYQSAEFTRSAFKWDGEQLWLAKMKEPLNIRWSQELPSKPSTVTVSMDSAGRYFVSLLCTFEPELLPMTPSTVGIDLGIKSVVVTDDGWESGAPQYTRKYEKQRAKAQRELAKKTLGSKNRLKAKRKVAKIHTKIADYRKDFTHKLTTTLINDNQVISIESLKVKNMVKNPTLSKSISDSGWGELVRQLEYKAGWYGRTLVAIDQWFPSSKTCSSCGHTLDKLDLSVRRWICPECHTKHDRDGNAARNIKAAGQAVLACGETVIPVSVNTGMVGLCETGNLGL